VRGGKEHTVFQQRDLLNQTKGFAFQPTTLIFRFVCVTTLLVALTASAQSVSLTRYATDLAAPRKMARTAGGSLLVTEAGVVGRGSEIGTTGRISVIDRTGVRHNLISGLPRTLSFIVTHGRSVYVGIGSYNISRQVQAPESPLISCVVRITFDKDIDFLANFSPLTIEHHYLLTFGGEVRLSDSAGTTATLELLTEFPDLLPAPGWLATWDSNPIAAAIDVESSALYVVDSGLGCIWKVDMQSGRARALVRFPAGRAWPVAITLYGEDELLVTFNGGLSKQDKEASFIRSVNRKTGRFDFFIYGLSGAQDLAVQNTSRGPQFHILEYSDEGRDPFIVLYDVRLLQVDSAGKRVLLEEAESVGGGFGSAGGALLQDAISGDLYVLLEGQGIVRVQIR
jgi:hypothetical protein